MIHLKELLQRNQPIATINQKCFRMWLISSISAISGNFSISMKTNSTFYPNSPFIFWSTDFRNLLGLRHSAPACTTIGVLHSKYLSQYESSFITIIFFLSVENHFIFYYNIWFLTNLNWKAFLEMNAFNTILPIYKGVNISYLV